MVRGRFFDHSRPGGVDLVERLFASRYLSRRERRWVVGENLAYGKRARATPLATVRAWMTSASHRMNILEPRFRELGLGLALDLDDGAPRTFITVNFGVREP